MAPLVLIVPDMYLGSSLARFSTPAEALVRLNVSAPLRQFTVSASTPRRVPLSPRIVPVNRAPGLLRKSAFKSSSPLSMRNCPELTTGRRKVVV